MKLGSKNNSNVLNPMVIFICSIMDEKYLFWVNLIQNCLFQVKFGTSTDSNLRNFMTMFNSFILDQKYPFGNISPKFSKLVPNFKLFFLSMTSFCSSSFVQIPENASAVQSILLINNTE